MPTAKSGGTVVVRRCQWAGVGEDPLMLQYHDVEWGVPVHKDVTHFEFLTLEGAQAGLSWQTVLRKRENYRKLLHGFNPSKVALIDGREIRELLRNTGIIRNRLKINSAISNAKMFLNIREEYGSFDSYVWRFVGGNPIKHGFKSIRDIPASTVESDALSKDLRKWGFRFVGSTICYAYMQAVGMVNDHTTGCFRYREISQENAW